MTADAAFHGTHANETIETGAGLPFMHQLPRLFARQLMLVLAAGSCFQPEGKPLARHLIKSVRSSEFRCSGRPFGRRVVTTRE